MEKTKIILEPMTLNEIKKAVKACNRGFHKVSYLKGKRLNEDGVVFMVGEMTYRFNLKYGENKIVKFENAVYSAATKADLDECERKLKALSDEQRQCVSSKTLDLLGEKKCCLAVGAPLRVLEKRKTEKERDADVPNVVYCGNGNTTLTCYKSFQYNIKKREYQKPSTKYYIKDWGGSARELDEGDISYASDIKKLKEEYRSSHKKKGGPSLVHSLSCDKILNISGKNREK